MTPKRNFSNYQVSALCLTVSVHSTKSLATLEHNLVA